MKTKSKALFKKITSNKKLLAAVLIVCVLCVFLIVGFSVWGNKNEEVAYKETPVMFGDLTVGVKESGTVDIGTVEQTFDLDMSALTRVTTNNSNSSTPGGGTGFGGGASMGGMGGMGDIGGGAASTGSNDMFSQMFNVMGNNSSSSSSASSSLTVEKVNVSVGQEIEVGDILLTLESEGVEELKAELESNVEKASADLEALEADKILSETTAKYTRDTSLEYGSFAEIEKNNTINSLKKDVEEAKENLDVANNTLSRYKEQLETAKADLQKAEKEEESLIWSRDNTNKLENTYLYCVAFNDAQTAISNADSLRSKVEQLESKVESAESTVSRCQSNYAKAKRNYASGLLSAEETYQLKMLAYDSAEETYDITLSYLEDDLVSQQETYDETLAKWTEFTSYIDGVNILSEYKGIVTEISLEEGDSLKTGSVVVTLYDAEDITVTVSVDEEDMTDIELGGSVNVSLTAYPDVIFEAEVTEISDATTDSSGNTTRDVTITFKGDVTKLFQGMTADITFITKQSREVLYVSNRAIINEGGRTYVKVKEEDGTIKKVRVATGFSDGVNVEITDGLTEGQTVLIEKGDA